MSHPSSKAFKAQQAKLQASLTPSIEKFAPTEGAFQLPERIVPPLVDSIPPELKAYEESLFSEEIAAQEAKRLADAEIAYAASIAPKPLQPVQPVQPVAPVVIPSDPNYIPDIHPEPHVPQERMMKMLSVQDPVTLTCSIRWVPA